MIPSLQPDGSRGPQGRFPWLLLLALTFSSCSTHEEAGRPAPARRVVLITCDTLRADLLGVYGQERPTTPRLDAFAEEAVVFDQAYSTSPWTQPAVSSLLTGLMPEEIGATPGNLRLMPPQVETLAELLSARGVATAAVVSNFLLSRPPERMAGAGVAQGFEHFDDRMTARELNRDMRERLAPDTTDAAIAWLEGHREREPERPFFLWVHFQDPHGPYTPPLGLQQAFEQDHGHEVLLPLGRSMLGKGQIPRYQVLGQEQRPGVYRDRYAAEVRFFDSQAGRLLDWLRAAGWYDDALIVFTSDHGESLGEHDAWFCHGENVQREVVRVPLLVRHPGGALPALPRGADGYVRDPGLAGHVDVWPTVLESLGLAAPPRRGVSLWRDRAPERVLMQSFVPVPGQGVPSWGVTDGRHRVVWSQGLQPRLYDLSVDPHETHDLMQERPTIAEQLVASWNSRAALLQPPQGEEPELDPETKRALQQLGYVEAEEQ